MKECDKRKSFVLEHKDLTHSLSRGGVRWFILGQHSMVPQLVPKVSGKIFLYYFTSLESVPWQQDNASAQNILQHHSKPLFDTHAA
jgi:hypothetical protein